MTEQLDAWRQQFRDNAEQNGLAAPTDAPAEPVADTATQPEPVADEQPRDEQGRYAPKEPAVASEPEPEQPPTDEPPLEPAAEETPDAESTDADVEKYLAKYGGDTTKALQAAVEAQKLIGRQGTELGQIRQELAQRFDQLEERQAAAQQQQQPAYSADEVQQFLDENPGLAPNLAERAVALNDDALYARAMTAWAESDQAGAMDYAGRVAAWKASNQLREEFAPILTQANETANAQAVTAAVEATAAKHADFAEVIDAVTPDVLNSLHPAILNDLKVGDAASKASALETLYYAARGVQSERQPQAQAAAQQAAQQNARQQRTDAAVGSANQANPQPRESASNVEQWRVDFRDSPEFRKAAGLT